ncbi:MAG: HpcH/HpaI aldolase family protein [Terriglobales bacterium]
MKSLKNMLLQQRLLVGMTTQHVTSHWLAKLWKHSGCDFVYLEYEHGFFDEARLADFVLSCRSNGLPIVAKVPECTRTHVAKLLECGVIGIQLPWTETKEQIERLVSYVKFPPIGIRAAAPGCGNCDYDLGIEGPQFVEQANRETVILAHIETRRGVENADEILSCPQVDIAFLGMYDLSISYGDAGNFRNPELAKGVEQVIATAGKHDKIVGMYVPDAETAQRWYEKGVTFFETASEVDLINQGAQRVIHEFRAVAEASNLANSRTELRS